MSKMDALRAMREARYAEDQARAAGSTAKSVKTAKAVPVRPPAAAKTPKKAEPATAAPAATEELCGHRNMSGRSCTREQGHSAKSHRYGATGT